MCYENFSKGKLERINAECFFIEANLCFMFVWTRKSNIAERMLQVIDTNE